MYLSVNSEIYRISLFSPNKTYQFRNFNNIYKITTIKLNNVAMDDSHLISLLISYSHFSENFTIQAESVNTLIVPWLLAVNIVGLSLFQHTALMK